MPQEFYNKSKRHNRRPDLIPKSWNDCLHIAHRFGTTAEWYANFGKALRLTSKERAELEEDLKRYDADAKSRHPCVMDIKHDAALTRLQKRASGRNAKWGDYKAEILRRCYNLLPPS
jgi:hypothetical protein